MSLLATHTTRIYDDGPVQNELVWTGEGNAPTSELQAEQLMDALQAQVNFLSKQRANRYFEDRPLGGANAHLKPYVEPVMQATQRSSGPAPHSIAPVLNAQAAPVVRDNVGFPPAHGTPGLPADATAEQVAAFNRDNEAKAQAGRDAQVAAQDRNAPAIQAAQARDSAIAAQNANVSAPVVVK